MSVPSSPERGNATKTVSYAPLLSLLENANLITQGNASTALKYSISETGESPYSNSFLQAVMDWSFPEEPSLPKPLPHKEIIVRGLSAALPCMINRSTVIQVTKVQETAHHEASPPKVAAPPAPPGSTLAKNAPKNNQQYKKAPEQAPAGKNSYASVARPAPNSANNRPSGGRVEQRQARSRRDEFESEEDESWDYRDAPPRDDDEAVVRAPASWRPPPSSNQPRQDGARDRPKVGLPSYKETESLSTQEIELRMLKLELAKRQSAPANATSSQPPRNRAPAPRDQDRNSDYERYEREQRGVRYSKGRDNY